MICLIVDDDDVSRKIMKQFIDTTEGLTCLASCASAVEAVGILEKEAIDLLFLDIEMPQMTGLELLKSVPVKPAVILTTARENYAAEAFEYEVTDYLVKPVGYARFLKAVQRAKERLAKPDKPVTQDNHLFVKVDSRFIRIPTEEIYFIKAMGDYVEIQSTRQKYITHSTLTSFLEKLPRQFLRVHRSYIVNTTKISTLEDNNLIINGEILPIGTVYKDAVLKVLGIS